MLASLELLPGLPERLVDHQANCECLVLLTIDTVTDCMFMTGLYRLHSRYHPSSPYRSYPLVSMALRLDSMLNHRYISLHHAHHRLRRPFRPVVYSQVSTGVLPSPKFLDDSLGLCW
jgi:hypothetical protein